MTIWKDCWEDNTASFPLSAAMDQQLTFLLAWCHMHSGIVHSPKGLSDSDMEKSEKDQQFIATWVKYLNNW